MCLTVFTPPLNVKREKQWSVHSLSHAHARCMIPILFFGENYTEDRYSYIRSVRVTYKLEAFLLG